MNFEENNLFKPKYERFFYELNKKAFNYQKEIHNLFDKINNFVHDKTNINKIHFISLIIQKLGLIYKYIKLNNIKPEMKEDIN